MTVMLIANIAVALFSILVLIAAMALVSDAEKLQDATMKITLELFDVFDRKRKLIADLFDELAKAKRQEAI